MNLHILQPVVEILQRYLGRGVDPGKRPISSELNLTPPRSTLHRSLAHSDQHVSTTCFLMSVECIVAKGELRCRLHAHSSSLVSVSG